MADGKDHNSWKGKRESVGKGKCSGAEEGIQGKIRSKHSVYMHETVKE